MSDFEIFKGAESWFSIDSNNCTTLVKTGTGGSLKKEEVVNTGCNLVWRVVCIFVDIVQLLICQTPLLTFAATPSYSNGPSQLYTVVGWMQACLAITIVEIASVIYAYSNQGEEAFEDTGSCFIPFPFFCFCCKFVWSILVFAKYCLIKWIFCAFCFDKVIAGEHSPIAVLFF